MNVELLKQKLSGPFRPFVIRTSDGREHYVVHPLTVLVAPRVIEILDPTGDIVHVDPLHVVAVQYLSSPASTAGTP